jgi:hypothetical protein
VCVSPRAQIHDLESLTFEKDLSNRLFQDVKWHDIDIVVCLFESSEHIHMNHCFRLEFIMEYRVRF